MTGRTAAVTFALVLSLPPEDRPRLVGSDSADDDAEPPASRPWRTVAAVLAAAALAATGGYLAARRLPPVPGPLAAVPPIRQPSAGLRRETAPPAAGAFDAAAAEPAQYRQGLLLGQAVGALDLPAVVAALDQEQAHRPTPRALVLDALFSRLAELDPPAAVTRAAQAFDGREHAAAHGALAAALAPWLARQPAGAIKWWTGLPPGSVRDLVSRALLLQVAERDPREALRLALEQTRGNPHTAPLEDIFARLAEDDPAAAMEAAGRLPNQEAVRLASGRVASVWAEKSPGDAFAGVRAARDLPAAVRTQAFTSIYAAWSGWDPVAASASLLAQCVAPRAPDDPPAADLPADVQAVAANWAERDSPAALRWVGQLPENYGRAGLGGAMETWGRNDPRAAASYAAALPFSRPVAAALEPVLDGWARADLNAAREWVRNLPAGPARDLSVARVARGWFEQDPQAALEFALAEQEDPVSFLRLVRNWTELDPERALRWTESLPASRDRDNVMANLMSALGGSDPVRASSLFAEVSPAGQAYAAQSLLDGWAARDPAAAAGWVTALPLGEIRDQATARLVQRWGLVDFGAACDWLAARPPGVARDGAVFMMVSAVGDTRRDVTPAIPLAEGIQNPVIRDNALETIARSWLRRDAVAASRWISQSADFSPRQRAILTARNEPPGE